MILKTLFGGTFGYIQAGLLGVATIAAIWLWKDYQGAKEDVLKLEGQVTSLKGQVISKDGVIASMGRTAGRRDAQNDQSKDLGNDILQATDGNNCASSEPIRIALDGLRIGAGTKAVEFTDETIPVLAGTYPARND